MCYVLPTYPYNSVSNLGRGSVTNQARAAYFNSNECYQAPQQEKQASNDGQAHWYQYKAASVHVVQVPDKTDPTHRVAINLHVTTEIVSVSINNVHLNVQLRS